MNFRLTLGGLRGDFKTHIAPRCNEKNMFWNWNEAGTLLSILGRLFLMAGVLILPHLPKILCKFSSRSWTKTMMNVIQKGSIKTFVTKKGDRFYSFTYFSDCHISPPIGGKSLWLIFEFPSPAKHPPLVELGSPWIPESPSHRGGLTLSIFWVTRLSHVYCAVKPQFGCS